MVREGRGQLDNLAAVFSVTAKSLAEGRAVASVEVTGKRGGICKKRENLNKDGEWNTPPQLMWR